MMYAAFTGQPLEKVQQYTERDRFLSVSEVSFIDLVKTDPKFILFDSRNTIFSFETSGFDALRSFPPSFCYISGYENILASVCSVCSRV